MMQMAKMKKIITGAIDHKKSNEPIYVEGSLQATDVKKDVFAVDIGFGYTKFKSSDEEGMIASICNPLASLAELQMSPGDIIDSLAVEHNGEIVLVGQLAAKYNRMAARSTYRERAQDENFEALYKAAIVAAYYQYPQLELTLVTGLPNDDLQDQKNDIQKKINEITSVSYYYDRTKYTIEIKYADVIVKTQPDGFWTEMHYDDNLEKVTMQNDHGEAIKRMGILDCGHGTLNMSLFEGNDILGIGTKTCSADGVHAIYDSVGMALKSNFKYDPSHLDIESAIVKEEVRIRGVIQNVSSLIRPIKEQYAASSFQAIYEKWKNELDQLNAIFIPGGGSNVIAEKLATLLAEKTRYTETYTLEDAQLLNVRGYYKIGQLSE